MKALLTGRTEAAVQGTAHLGRHAQGAALTIRYEYGFHFIALIQLNYPLAGAIIGKVLQGHLWPTDFSHFRQLGPQCFTQVCHCFKVICTEEMDPLHYLMGTEALFSDRFEEILHLRPGHPQQINF